MTKTIEEFINELTINVQQRNTKFPEWRLGQTYFNVLYELRPDIADKIRGQLSTCDCFYNDKLIPNFLDAVKLYYQL